MSAPPEDAEALLAQALGQMRADDEAAMVRSLKACAKLRRGDWILDRLRQDFAARGRPAMRRPDRLGEFLRGQFSPLGPPLPADRRGARHAFVNVIGSSYVRSFGASTALLPIFVGMGPTMLLLTEEAAALTGRKMAANLKRVDASRDTLIVLGGDAFYHWRNLLGTRAQPRETVAAEDREVMQQVAARHGAILAEARAQLTGRVYLLASTPTFSPLVNDLSRLLNELLQPVCQACGVELLDPWDLLADPETGFLRSDLAAQAYEGDIHFSLETTPLFIELLKARGSLPPDLDAAESFAWSSVFDCLVEGERTRIWCEPNVVPKNAFRSDKIAYSHLTETVANLVTYLLAGAEGRKLLMVNVTDGGPCVLVPKHVHSGALAITDNEPNRRAAQMALDFYGRDDISLHLFDEAALSAVADDEFAETVILIHPGHEVEDEARANAVLARLKGNGRVIVGASDPSRIDRLNLAGRRVSAPLNISNRHIPERWREFSLITAVAD